MCDLEPIFLACGQKTIALGLNNHVWLYSAFNGELQRKLQYAGSVESIQINDTHVAALVDGKVHFQLVSCLFFFGRVFKLVSTGGSMLR